MNFLKTFGLFLLFFSPIGIDFTEGNAGEEEWSSEKNMFLESQLTALNKPRVLGENSAKIKNWDEVFYKAGKIYPEDDFYLGNLKRGFLRLGLIVASMGCFAIGLISCGLLIHSEKVDFEKKVSLIGGSSIAGFLLLVGAGIWGSAIWKQLYNAERELVKKTASEYLDSKRKILG